MLNDIERLEPSEISTGEVENLYDTPSPEIESLDDAELDDGIEVFSLEQPDEDTPTEISTSAEDLDSQPLEDGNESENVPEYDDHYHAIPNSERFDNSEEEIEPYRAIPNSERSEIAEDDSAYDSMESALKPFEENNWNELDTDEQKEAVEGLADNVCEDLGIENPPNIEYYNADKNDCGAYDPRSNTLYINEANLPDSEETADTVAHELRHAYQHQCANNPENSSDPETARLYQENFDNYIRPEDDFDGYQNQIVEADARDYAQQIRDQIH